MLFGVLILAVLMACSKSDDGPTAAPEVSYEQQIMAGFYTTGNSGIPQVNWNGDIGQFGLQKNIEGLSIDKNTGVLSWSKLLPVGKHEVNVIVFNNSGSDTATITLENPLVGKFKGDLFPSVTIQGNKNYILEFDFKEDGTLTGFTQLTNKNDEIEGPFEFFGNFTTEKNEVHGSFQYEEVADPIPIGGLIKQTEQQAMLSGTYYPDIICETEFCVDDTAFELVFVVE